MYRIFLVLRDLRMSLYKNRILFMGGFIYFWFYKIRLYCYAVMLFKFIIS